MSSPDDPTGGLAFLARSRPFLASAAWEKMSLPALAPEDAVAYKGTHPDGWTFTVVSFPFARLEPRPVRPGDPLVHYDALPARGYDGAVASAQECILCHMTTEFAHEAFETAEKALAK